MNTTTPSRLVIAICAVAFAASCSKTSLSPALPAQTQADAQSTSLVTNAIVGAHFYPMNDYFATLTTNENDPFWYEEWTGNLGNPDYTASEIGYCFRSAAKGKVISVGVNLPASGYWHQVTVWDSVTGDALARAQILTVGSTWIYTDLDTIVPIKANHGYIVTVNTAVDGIKINQYTPAETVFFIAGIYVTGGSPLPILPATDGPVTIEQAIYYDYGTQHLHPLPFPGSGTMYNEAPETFFGFCDIGFNKD